ncbi:universal stress protein [Flavobacterium sinopsychrotolerans]|uniref:Nucleotide-binding universal stress protein, UspA family n=1 Tax=Flavobacterium sinopsychrotolerans TaxID=604089 RepID=A0A1H8RET4_9FLAO|nr:universal stress protein [Flavobacterium sinopsychrotolerans]SEO64654.1 Nucleotide-binding universal stress protein, UspA family [Flavobacterium sinopsychrotolerans]
MKKILFPTDFSEVSKNAFIYALKLAESINAEIVTMHVYQLPQANYINVSEYLHEIYDVTELSNFENYKDEVPILRSIAEANNLDHIKISHVLILGNLILEIQKIINEEDIDFVVMGTKGATGLKETFLGTVATKVMNDVKAVVLAIPEHCKYHPIEKILFITEYKPEDTASFLKVMDFAKIFQAHIDCLRVEPVHHEVKNDYINNWNEIIKNKDIIFHSIKGDDVEGIILNFIDLHKINLVAMHVHHRNFFEKLFEISLSKKLAFHINVPILAIHE